jgi:hypothetical protein
VTSDKQARANRQNTRKSTGPKTPEGKAVARLNAVKYGLSSCKRHFSLTGHPQSLMSSFTTEDVSKLNPRKRNNRKGPSFRYTSSAKGPDASQFFAACSAASHASARMSLPTAEPGERKSVLDVKSLCPTILLTLSARILREVRCHDERQEG